MSIISATSTPTPTNKLDQLLLCAVDLALAGVVFGVPLFMGGWHPLGHLVYVALVSVGLTAWCLRQAIHPQVRWRFSGIELVLLAGTAILALQAAALPPDVVAKLSPLSAELLPLWSADAASGAGLGHWTHISLMPEATRRLLMIWLAHVGLFLLVVQRVQAVEDVERLLRWIAIAAVGMAALGLAQFLVGNGKFLWVYEHPYRDTAHNVKGMFANQNHLAHFMALGIGPLLWWLARLKSPTASDASSARGRRPPRRGAQSWGRGVAGGQEEEKLARLRLALYFGIGAVALAGLLTFSRGGVLMLFMATALSVALLAALRAFGRKALAGLAVAAAAVAVAMFVYGYQPLADQLATLAGDASDQPIVSENRWPLWAADMQAFIRTPLLGTGAGTHAEVYPIFFPHHSDVEYTQPESGYVGVLLETGVAGAVIVFFLWAFALRWSIAALRSGADPRIQFCAVAIGAGLFVSIVHSLWDYVWFVPACMSLVVVLAACGCRLWQMTRAADPAPRAAPIVVESSRFSWAVASFVVLVLGCMAVHNRIGPALAASGWERFLALQQAERALGEKASTDALLAPIADSLRHDPEQARVQVRMAAICLRKFEEQQQQSEAPLPLSQIRDAARVSQFASLAEQDEWLARVLGDNRKWLDAAHAHARSAVSLCPLQGEAYTLLAELSFLDGPGPSSPAALINQALRVRPREAHVLFAAGREAALTGKMQQALALWQSAFQHDPQYRQLIIALVAPQSPAEQILAQFQPDLDATRDIFRFYRDGGYINQAQVVARRLATQIEQQAQGQESRAAAKSWHEAFRLHLFLGDDAEALTCIRKAVEAAPFEYDYRRDLAARLVQAGLIEEAIVEIRWCRQRNRADAQLEKLWEIAKRGPQLRQPIAAEAVEETAQSPATTARQ